MYSDFAALLNLCLTLHQRVITAKTVAQVGNKEALNCYYAHADQEDQLQVCTTARLLAHDFASHLSCRPQPRGPKCLS